MSTARRLLTGFCALHLLTMIAACSGDKTVSTMVTPPPAAVDPTAAFTAPASATALQPVALDASTSSSTDGSALQYVWDFGNGQRGGGVKIAHVFAVAGDNTVKLTVIDGSSRMASNSKIITIAAPTAPTTTVTALVLTKGIDGAPLAGVAVTPTTAASAASDADGKVTVAVTAGAATTIKFSKTGYADQFLNLAEPAGAGNEGYVEVTLSARDAALTLADAAVGGTLTARDGATITLPANAFIDANGVAVTGAIQMSVTPVDVTQAGAGGFPGGFEGVQADGTMTSIVSAGVNEFVPTANGAPLQLAPGKSATITIPIYAAKKLDGSLIALGDVIPLWSLDEATGIWIQEGTGTVVAASASPSGLALSATVTHLSWWNCDFGFFPYGPKPKCVAQGAIGIPGSGDPFVSAGICNMLAEIDRGLGGAGSGTSTGAAVASGSSAHAQANAWRHAQASPREAILVPREVAFSRQYAVPIAGGKSIGVPADVDVRLTAYALNGTWTGSTIVHGSGGVEDDVVITLHPVAAASAAAEAITLPFDDSRNVASAATTLFTFTATAPSVARVSVEAGAGSAFAGQLSVLEGTTVLATATVNVGEREQAVAYLPAAGTYTIAVESAGPSAFRMIAALEPSDAQIQPITLPFVGTRSLLPQATATFSFSGTLSQYARIVVTTPTGVANPTPLSGTLTLLNGTAVIGSVALSGNSSQLLTSLPANGNFTIQVTGTAAASFQLAADIEGGVQGDVLALPSDVTVTLPAETVYRGTFTVSSVTSVWMDSRHIDGEPTEVKLVAPDGTVLFDSPPTSLTNTESDLTTSGVVILQPGSYAVQIGTQTGKAATERVTLAATPWGPVAPSLPVSNLFKNIGLVMDRNAKPVVGLIASSLVNGTTSYTLQLRRWTGTAWETVGSDIAIGGYLCDLTAGANFAFDSANNPVLLYASEVTADASSYFQVQRFSGGAWAAIGANGGKLPFASRATDVCGHPSTLLIGADDQPVVAYATDGGGTVLHFDGSNWVGYVTPAGDVFGDAADFFEANFDPAGSLWFIASDRINAQGTAKRLNTNTRAWEAVGGAFPQTGRIIGLQQPRLRFDSAGSPVVAWAASVGANGTGTGGVAVYRFDGTQWSTDGGHEADDNSSAATAPDPAFVLFNDQAVVAWDSQDNTRLLDTVAVHTNTAAGWTPIGGGSGTLPQYSESGVSASTADNPKLATDGTDVYMTVISIPQDTSLNSLNSVLTLLKKTGN